MTALDVVAAAHSRALAVKEFKLRMYQRGSGKTAGPAAILPLRWQFAKNAEEAR